MTSGSSGSGQNSNGSGTNGGASGNNATQKVREFLYLNQNRVFSYLSQLDGGLKLLYSKVKEDSWSETIGDAETTTDVGVNVSATVEGKIALLAGMSGEVAGDWKRSTKSGGDTRTDGERNTSSELFGLHHRAFDLVMEKIGSRFTLVTGQIFIIDASGITEDVKDFAEIIKNINVFVPAANKMTTPANLKQMHYLFKKYLKNKILVILRTSNDEIYTAYLEDKHLLYPIGDIVFDYGVAPTGAFTLIGMRARPQAALNAGSFSVPHVEPEAQAIADQFAGLVSAMQGMADFFAFRSATGHLVPLALFSEF